MDKNEFNELLNKIMDNGISITMYKDKDTNVICYDLDTKMKSHLIISHINNECVYEARYNKSGKIKSYDDLLDTITDCMCGRDFGNEIWLSILDNRYETNPTKSLKPT